MSGKLSPAAAGVRKALEQDDGADRAPLLPLARLITLAPSADTDEPVDVAIVWAIGHTEFPLPGSSLWRAALMRWLDAATDGTLQDRIVREQIERSLDRFPSLDTWWAWISSGWTAPMVSRSALPGP